MTGIYDCFGYGPGYEVPFEERYRLIRDAGFDCVMLWWSDQFGRGDGYREDARLAGNVGLHVENMHAPVHEQNCLSMDNLRGESVLQAYLQCVEDCAAYQIATVVVHLPDDTYPIDSLGMRRLDQLICKAEEKEVQIALENLRNIRNLALVLDTFESSCVKFCYDSCHHSNYAPETDLLKQYGNRLAALHLHDNGGKHNQHQLPFDGTIDWSDVMKKITLAGYRGATVLEPMNWDYESQSIREFLDLAYQRARRLDEMRKT